MAVQIVMDPTGDMRHEFNTSDAAAAKRPVMSVLLKRYTEVAEWSSF